MKWRHSKWCQAEDKDRESMCSCGHPLCLHQEVASMTVLNRPGKCRAKDCEGQCENYTPIEAEY